MRFWYQVQMFETADLGLVFKALIQLPASNSHRQDYYTYGRESL